MRQYLLLLLVVLGLALMGCTPQATQDVQAVPHRQITADALEAEVRAAFGADLESVTVTSDGARAPTYRGEFTLRGLRLVFAFQLTPQEQAMTSPKRARLLHHRTLVHNEALGGNARFVALAKRYAADFPDQPSMSYWTPDEGGTWPGVGETAQRILQPLVTGDPGPHVLVFDYNDYWRDDDRRAMPLGVYTWDAGQEDWRLLSRGPIPLD
jgi:hypothetical protein